MANFAELRTVLMAANEAVKAIEETTIEMQRDINDINNERWDEVVNYFEDLVDTCRSCNIYEANVYFAIPGTGVIVHPFRTEGHVQLGVFVNDGNVNEKGEPKNRNFIRWIILYDDYAYTIHSCKEARIEVLVKYMKDHWDEIEEGVSYNFKDAITKVMAYKVKEATEKAETTRRELINL